MLPFIINGSGGSTLFYFLIWKKYFQNNLHSVIFCVYICIIKTIEMQNLVITYRHNSLDPKGFSGMLYTLGE
ncbi:MAG: hypothetical protein K0S33_1809 [Bacteroidetes bacterium]|jgi:hypothetical protein|nr:hypothetical protein [Bacteroidota bacterium]